MTMTLPVHRELLTVKEYAALGDDDSLRRLELQEGNVVVPGSPTLRHMRASGALFLQVGPQLPAHLEAFYEIDVDLQLVPPEQPGTVRQPDLVVATRAECDRASHYDVMLRASGVVLAVEIVSPGSRRTDSIIKRAEYADAGIPHYWIVDLDPEPALTACELLDGSYRDTGPVSGTFAADAPFPVRLDLAALLG